MRRPGTLLAVCFVVAAMATGSFIVHGRAAGLNFHFLTSIGRLVAQDQSQTAPASVTAVCTWNGSVDLNWATAANWTGCTGGGAPAAADSVLLDNSLKAGSYSVNLPTGAVTVSIVRLTITPGAGNTITLTLPSGNTANPGFSVGDATAATDDIILNNGAVLRNSSGAGAGNGIEGNTTANGTVRINNGGRYVHNSARSTAGTVPLLSSVAGTETGIYEYDSPGTGSVAISASGRNYGSLTLTRTAGAAIYTATGGSALTLRGNLLTNAGVTYNSTMTGAMNLSGNLTNSGAALALSQPVNFNGNTTITGSASVTISSATSTVAASSTLALGVVTFSNTGTLTVTGNLQINQGGFPGGAGTYSYNASTGTLIFNNSAGSFGVNNDNYWPTVNGPQNVIVQGTGGIMMTVARNVGNSFQYAAGVSGAGNLTLNTLSQINPGGFVSGSPTYGAGTLLRYNTGGSYGRNGEWLPGVTSGAGYPHHVQLSNNTTLDLPNSSGGSTFQMAGDLTIDAGSTMQLSGGTPLTQTLTIFGSVNNNGILNLSNASGADVNVGGNWNNNGTFNNNGRTVNLNGSIGQTITGNSNFFNLTKSSAVAQTLTFAALSTQTITNALTLNGASGNLLSLRSNTPGTQWKLNVLGTSSVSFVDVKDSDASGGSSITPANSVDSGNNLNWIFATANYTVTTTSNTIVVSDISGNSDTLTMSEPSDGLIKFSAPGRFFSVDGGPLINGDSGNLNLVGIAFITVNQNGGNDQMVITTFGHSVPDVTINGGVGDDLVRFSGTLAFQANRNLDVDLQNDDPVPGVDQVIFDAGSNLSFNGNGGPTLKVSKNITLSSSANLQVSDGNATLEANQQPTPTVGAFSGLYLNGGTVQTVGAGNVVIKGKGGAGDFTDNIGVFLNNGGKVKSNAAGTLDVQGTGGDATGGSDGAGSGNIGVYMTLSSEIRSASSATLVTGTGGTCVGVNGTNVIGVSADELATFVTDGAGNFTINGTGGTVTGGGSSTFVNSGGIFIVFGGVNGDGGSVKSTGTGPINHGNIIMNGTANPAGNGSAQGVRVDAPASVTSADGNISITGTSATCSNACLGTSIRGNVTATGIGLISITGTGGITNGAFPTHGVNVRSGGVVSAVSGGVTITGTGGSGSSPADNAGFALAPSAAGTVQTTGSGNITVNADSMRITPTAAANMNAGGNTVNLRQKTNGTLVDLGSATDVAVNTLELSDGELDRVFGGTLNLGNALSGAITVTANITRSTATALALTSGANIDIAGGSLNSNGGDVSLVPGTNAFPSNSSVDVTTSATKTLTLTSAKDLKIVINNTTVDSGYTQLNVAGLVNLNNANLALSGALLPAAGQQFIIVNNDGADAITGTFNGLSEGAVIPNFLGSTLSARINYGAGDGNDAVLTVLAPEIAVEQPAGTDLTDGSATIAFGSQNVGVPSAPKTFTIRNTGTANLTIGTISTVGGNNADFSVNTSGLTSPVTPGNSTTFTVTFTPSASGARSTSLQIVNNDSDENPFDITLNGTGTCPTSFTVNSNLDTGDVAPGDGVCLTAGGECTLRAAIQEANNSPCGAIDIGFSIPTSTVTVGSELQLSHAMNINGPTTASITVAAIPSSPTRVFNTLPGQTVSLNNLTVSGGRAGTGGGLLAQGPSSNTTLTGMLFTGNTAIDGSGVAGGGGAASINGGGLTIINSTFSGNMATNGGGIDVVGGGQVTLVNATITNNNASGDIGGGPCGVDGDGGGLAGSTMPAPSFALRNTIVTGNQDCTSNNPDVLGGFNDLGNNLTTGNALLGPLANNGGPTFTHSLLNLSPAIDAGNDCVLTNVCVPPVGVNITTDQRGFARPANGDTVPGTHVDIGAFEKQIPSASNSSITGRIVDQSGNALEGVAVRMAGTQDRLAVTDSEGNYHFDEVQTGGFYTITPSRLNFVFAPVQRSFSQLGQHTDAVFTAAETAAGANPLDAIEYFVRQQYLDFLGREPDEAGLTFWVRNLESCGADSTCLAAKRDDTSAAFFLSIEFQQTGYLVYRMYQSAYGELPGSPAPVKVAEFRPDTRVIGKGVVVNENGWQAKLEANKQAFALEFVSRARFVSTYPTNMTAASFVDKLFLNARVTPDDIERTTAINEFAGAANTADLASRARALRRVAENATLQQQEFNRAFVLMQYFGYLGRDPNAAPDADFSGYNFWLYKLESFDGDFRRAEMVKAFLVASEYRSRFTR